jgi:rubredoxin
VGLFTTTEDKQLEEARKHVVPSEVVCPGCKQPFTAGGPTLSAVNPALGLEAHKCPHCGHILSSRRPSPDGL